MYYFSHYESFQIGKTIVKFKILPPECICGHFKIFENYIGFFLEYSKNHKDYERNEHDIEKTVINMLPKIKKVPKFH